MTAANSASDPIHKYRPDIDGLRAIAVLAVVLYHAGARQLSGGFVGVDVFFVISGYLITQYIDRRVEAAQFSIVEFYERRVRRILPALFFLLLFATLAAYFLLLPKDLIKFAKSEIATLLFFPNLFFYRWGSGYFDPGTKLKPLLHMWSLGVEEQFYIFFPIVVFVVARWGRHIKLASLWALFAISFAASCWAVQYHGVHDEAFYLVPFRAWELLLGALIALHAFPPIKSAISRNSLAAIGLCAILISAFTYSSSTSFPGLSALLPCLGTALVIYANESHRTFIGRFLSSRPFVFFGLISYSLYLWHWPVLVYARQFVGGPMTLTMKTFAILFSIVAATLSWRYVERPFRGASSGIARKALFLQAAVAGACLLAVSQACVWMRGLPQRFPQQAVTYADAGGDWGTAHDVCRTPRQIEARSECHFGAGTQAQPSFILWGDSHAESLAPVFDVLAQTSGSSGWIASFPACLPLPDVHRVDVPGCPQFNDAIISLIEQNDIRTIILAARWAVPSLGLSDGELEDGRQQVLLYDSSSRSRSLPENERVLDRGLRRILPRLSAKGRNVILVMDVPDTGVNTPRYLAQSVIEGKMSDDRQDARIAMSAYSKASLRVDSLVTAVAEEFHASTIDPKSKLCDGSECLIARVGQSLYHDSNHLTRFGALELVDLFRPLMPKAISQGAQPATPSEPKAHSITLSARVE